jgi:hypothetical protein
MITIETSHYPSADDISFDSLEYLFKPIPEPNDKAIPWVNIEPANKLDELRAVDMQSKVELLEKQLQQSVRQTQRLCILIGYLQGVIHAKDEQLKTLPDLRFLAGLSVARGLEAERYKEKVQELEAGIELLSKGFWAQSREMLRSCLSYLNTDEAAISMLMWLGFISLSGILLTMLRGF